MDSAGSGAISAPSTPAAPSAPSSQPAEPASGIGAKVNLFADDDAEPITDAEPANEVAEAPAEVIPEQPKEKILGKFDSHEDLEKAYQELEKTFHAKTQEQSQLEQYLAQQAQNQNPQTQEAPIYFHQLQPEQQQQFAKQYADYYADNPLQASFDLETTLPQKIEQHLMRSPVVDQLVMRKFFELDQQYREKSNHYNSMISDFMGKNPKAKQYENELAGTIQSMMQTGQLQHMMATKQDFLDHALKLVLGSKLNDELSAVEQATIAKYKTDAKQANAGFQLGSQGSPKGKSSPGKIALADIP